MDLVLRTHAIATKDGKACNVPRVSPVPINVVAMGHVMVANAYAIGVGGPQRPFATRIPARTTAVEREDAITGRAFVSPVTRAWTVTSQLVAKSRAMSRTENAHQMGNACAKKGGGHRFVMSRCVPTIVPWTRTIRWWEGSAPQSRTPMSRSRVSRQRPQTKITIRTRHI